MHLVVVGDSVPAGHGCGEPAWPAQLADRIDTLERADVTADAAMGRTLSECVDRLDAVLDRTGEPAVALVQAGHNDAQLSGGSPRVPRSEFAKAASRVGERLTDEAVAGAAVGLVPLLPGRSLPFSEDQPDRALEYDRTLAEAVGSHLRVVGGGGPTALDDWAALTVDGVHPNATGHARIADAVAPWLRDLR